MHRDTEVTSRLVAAEWSAQEKRLRLLSQMFDAGQMERLFAASHWLSR